MRSRVLVLALAAMFVAPAALATPKFTVVVVNGTMRVLPGGVPAAGYMTLRNFTDVAVRLTGASSPGCGMIMIHKSSNTGGMSRMEMLSSLDVAAHGEAKFQQGGLHLMCMDPKPEMLTAKRVNVTLEFEGRTATASFVLTDARGVPHK